MATLNQVRQFVVDSGLNFEPEIVEFLFEFQHLGSAALVKLNLLEKLAIDANDDLVETIFFLIQQISALPAQEPESESLSPEPQAASPAANSDSSMGIAEPSETDSAVVDAAEANIEVDADKPQEDKAPEPAAQSIEVAEVRPPPAKKGLFDRFRSKSSAPAAEQPAVPNSSSENETSDQIPPSQDQSSLVLAEDDVSKLAEADTPPTSENTPSTYGQIPEEAVQEASSNLLESGSETPLDSLETELAPSDADAGIKEDTEDEDLEDEDLEDEDYEYEDEFDETDEELEDEDERYLSDDSEEPEHSEPEAPRRVLNQEKWWSEDEGESSPQEPVTAISWSRPNVTDFMDVEFASKTHVHKVIETHFDQTLELSWPEYPGASNYIICAEEDHYPFEIRQSSALANVETTRAEVPDHLSYFTVFAFTPQSPKGVPWARGRFVTDIQWLTAEALENSAALRWPQIAAGATLRVCRSLPDQPLPEIPSANYWLPIDAATRSYVDTGISLGKKYQYRAYLEWDGVDGAIHSTMGKSVSLLALFEFPEIQQFTAGLDADVSGVVQCQVLGKVTSDNVRIFEIEELPSPELLAAVADKAQLPTEELDRIDQRSWLGQPLLANYQNVASGVLATSQLVNSKTITKTFVLVIVLGSIAQVTSLVSIQQIGAIHSAELIDRFDYQVIRIPEPIGAQSFDIWIVAQSVPFSHVAHTPPSRRIIVQDEYLRYGGILFADNVPDRPQVRKLTSHKQTIYIRGAASFDGETEFGPVVQIDYPGRIELHYGITDPPEPAKAKKAKKYRWWKFWLWKQRPKKKKNVATNEAKGEALAAAPETNATVDRIGNALLGQSKSEVKPDVIDSSVLEKFLGGLRNIGIWPKAKHENPTDPSNLLLLKVEGLDASQQLKELSVMHFAGSVLPIDEHDAEVSKTPISLEITDYERAFQPYKLNTNEAKAEDPGLLLEKSLRHRLQVQCDPFTDLLHGYRCFSIDDGTPLQNKPRSAAESAELELTVAVVGAPKSGKSTYLAALMNYLEQQYELLVDAEVRDIAGEDSLRTITKQLAQGGKLPRSGRPITGNGDSPVSHLEFASRSPIPMRKLNLIDTSGLNLAEPAALKMAESALLDSDLLIITIDPTQNPAVTELLTGLVNRNAEREDPDQPFWVLESIVSFLVENQELRKPGQRIAFVVTKSDSIEIASKSPGTPLAGVIRSGMAMARDPHLLSRANYNQSFGSLLSSETQGVLRRMSRMGPFLKLVKDSFNPEFVRFFSVTALSKTNHSDNLGGLGLTSQRISDPLRWSIESIAADRESDSPDKKPASTQTRK